MDYKGCWGDGTGLEGVCVCVCVCERERETEPERQRQRLGKSSTLSLSNGGKIVPCLIALRSG